MTNEAQIEHWSGEGGRRWAEDHERYDRMLAPYGRHLVEAVAPAPGERVLDVGCGNAAVTLDVARRVEPGGEAVGVDIATPMLELARRRAGAAGIGNARFVEADAQVHPFEPAAFDAVVSRFGVMFFDDPEAAFANIATGLRPAGRLAFTCWRSMGENEWMMVPVTAALEHVPIPPMPAPGAPGPYAFADPDRVRAVLAAGGFVDVALTEVDEAMRVGDTAAEMVEFLRDSEMARTLFGGVDDDTAAAAWASVTRAIEARQTGDGVVLGGAAWLVTARRP